MKLPRASTVQTGHQAEIAAAEYLVRGGYEIHHLNWRRRNCEIDIVAYRQQCLHFVEVKFREHNEQGGGMEYVTAAKIRRMQFGAKIYSQSIGWQADINLAVIEVSGPDNNITGFIESIECDA